MELNDTKIVSDQPEAQNAENTSWYVLRIISGKERKVKEFLEKEAIRNNWQNVVKQFFLPIE
ncbi:MAG: transcription termination/antitermination factor NusG, partial [Sediminibacterium sp.]|nr:transcription termination/antitermination factor NusG [Sediminibacterium sp.]